MDKFIPALSLICILLLINPLTKFIKVLTDTIDNIRKYHAKLNLNSELHNLSPREFELWCAEYLRAKGYKNVTVSPVGADSGVDIGCILDNELIFVECKRYLLSHNAKYKVDANTIRTLVGAMEGSNVKRGMVVTTGIVTNDALEFIKTLPDEYMIEIIDGKVFDIDYHIDNFSFSLLS